DGIRDFHVTGVQTCALPIFTGGDDGRVVATGADGTSEAIAAIGNKWIDHVALGSNGALAWSAGKTAYVRTKKGERTVDVPSTVRSEERRVGKECRARWSRDA